jgi:hypothetical protein
LEGDTSMYPFAASRSARASLSAWFSLHPSVSMETVVGFKGCFIAK